MVHHQKPYTKVELPNHPWLADQPLRMKSTTATRFHLIQGGKLRINWQNRVLKADSSSILVMPPGMSFRAQCLSPQVDRITLHLRPGAWAPAHQADADAIGLLQGIRDIANEYGPLLPCRRTTRERLDALFHDMVRLWNRPDLRHHRVSLKALAMQVLAVLDEDERLHKLSLGTASAASKQAAERIEPALHHLEQKDYIIQEHLSVGDMARLCGYRSSQFHALFVTATGSTPQQYLTERRIALACNLLRQGRESVLQIAFQCGFNSQSRFYHAFNTIMGVSPAKWRRQQNNTLGP